MLNRRLWILLVAFVLGFVVLAVRLAKLQLVDAEEWRGHVAQFLHPQAMIETYRGTLVDRKNQVLARDVPSDELAIDYRALSLDDNWLGKRAIEILRANREWGKFPSRTERNRRLAEVKADLAAKIEAYPDVLAAALAPLDGITPEEAKELILSRRSEIIQRIHIMKQDVWLRRYNPDTAGEAAQASSGGSDDLSDTAIDALYRRIQLRDEVAAHTLRASLPPDLALYFKSHAADFPGLLVRDKAEFNRREYPYGESAAHIVGTLRSIDAQTLSDRRFRAPDLLAGSDPGDLGGYLPGDRIGELGMEAYAESMLHGSRGVRLLDLGGETTTASAGRRIDAVPGRTVQLTLDAALQRDLYESLSNPVSSLTASVLGDDTSLLRAEDGKDHFAALVVLGIDGQVMALVSYPSYDPNTIATTRVKLMRDEYRRPQLNRAIQGSYPPGSTVKPLLAAAGLTEKIITPTADITCTGHFYPSKPDILKCDATSGHGSIELVDALSKSCNVYFYTVGQRLGIERLVSWYDGYGVGRASGLELGGAKGALKPDLADPDMAARQAILLGIGQGPIDVTPLQLANAYATLLRGGVEIPPHLLAGTGAPGTQRLNIAPQTLAVVRQGMERCTISGTGKAIFGNLRLRVAGKTGTAEKERPVFDDAGKPVYDQMRPVLNADRTPRLNLDGTPMYRQLVERHDDAWFIGYAPADNPRFVVAAILEWGGHGGTHAAPMAREAILQLQRHGYLPPLDLPR